MRRMSRSLSAWMLIGCAHAVRQLSLVTWNLLAPRFTLPDKYPWASADALDWERRFPRVVSQLAELDADVVCLQEIERPFWPELHAALARFGYEGVLQESGATPPTRCYPSRSAPLRAASYPTLASPCPDMSPTMLGRTPFLHTTTHAHVAECLTPCHLAPMPSHSCCVHQRPPDCNPTRSHSIPRIPRIPSRQESANGHPIANAVLVRSGACGPEAFSGI